MVIRRLRRIGPAVAVLCGVAALSGCRASHKATIAQGASPEGVELPVRFVWNLPVVDAEICGRPVRLIVDTGGHDTITLLPRAAADLPCVSGRGGRSVTLSAAGDWAINRGFTAEEVRLGPLIFTQVEGHELTQLPEALATHVDGYVGSAVLSRFGILVDFPDRIVLYPASGTEEGGFVPPQDWVPVPLSGSRASPALLDGHPISVIWDTGANHTVIDPSAADRLGANKGDRVTATLALGGVDFGPVEMRRYPLRGPGVEVVLGHNFFMEHRVLLDQASGTAYIER